MKETKTIAKAANFTAVDFGKMSDIKEWVLRLRFPERYSEVRA